MLQPEIEWEVVNVRLRGAAQLFFRSQSPNLRGEAAMVNGTVSIEFPAW